MATCKQLYLVRGQNIAAVSRLALLNIGASALPQMPTANLMLQVGSSGWWTLADAATLHPGNTTEIEPLWTRCVL